MQPPAPDSQWTVLHLNRFVPEAIMPELLLLSSWQASGWKTYSTCRGMVVSCCASCTRHKQMATGLQWSHYGVALQADTLQ